MKSRALIIACLFAVLSAPLSRCLAAPPSVTRAYLENACRYLDKAVTEAERAARLGGLPVDWKKMLGDLRYVRRNLCLVARPEEPSPGRAYEARPDREELGKNLRNNLLKENDQ